MLKISCCNGWKYKYYPIEKLNPLFNLYSKGDKKWKQNKKF
jgi:hypothetical protein